LETTELLEARKVAQDKEEYDLEVEATLQELSQAAEKELLTEESGIIRKESPKVMEEKARIAASAGADEIAEAEDAVAGKKLDGSTPTGSQQQSMTAATAVATVEEPVAAQEPVNRTLAPGHRGAWEDEELHGQVVDAPTTAPGAAVAAAISDATRASVGVTVNMEGITDAAKLKARPQTVADEDDEDEDEAPDLTTYELQAIGDLARSSFVQREKEALTQLKSQFEALLSRSAGKKKTQQLADGEIMDKSACVPRLICCSAGVKGGDVEEVDKTISNMVKVLTTMNTNLETKINATEQVNLLFIMHSVVSDRISL
jgi:hypothetical protein